MMTNRRYHEIDNIHFDDLRIRDLIIDYFDNGWEVIDVLDRAYYRDTYYTIKMKNGNEIFRGPKIFIKEAIKESIGISSISPYEFNIICQFDRDQTN